MNETAYRKWKNTRQKLDWSDEMDGEENGYDLARKQAVKTWNRRDDK